MAAAPVLVVIDAQEAFRTWRAAGHPWANTEAETRIADLLAAFRAAGWPILHVHHHGTDPRDEFHPANPGARPMQAALPQAGEPVMIKHTSSAFVGTDLVGRLQALGNPALVIAGGAANFCVNSTTRSAADLGFRATLAADALINFGHHPKSGAPISADQVLALTLADLEGEFASVASTAQILAQLA